jgi:hypothetical protein
MLFNDMLGSEEEVDTEEAVAMEEEAQHLPLLPHQSLQEPVQS